MATAPLGRAASQGLKRVSPWASLTSAKMLTRADVEEAISYATAVGLTSRAAGPWRDPRGKPRKLEILDGRVLATLFFEPSTRTTHLCMLSQMCESVVPRAKSKVICPHNVSL